ncbi:hypothetical protein ACFQ0M_05480 [Kitasatospora aburaviensis]
MLDAGLPARAVLAAEPKCVVLRDPFLAEEVRARLVRDVPGLSSAERDWYAEGWWSPLVALPPKRLMAAAVRAAEQLTAPAAPVPLQKAAPRPETLPRPADGHSPSAS